MGAVNDRTWQRVLDMFCIILLKHLSKTRSVQVCDDIERNHNRLHYSLQ